MSALALVSDLMMQSQLVGAAQRAGVQLKVVSSEDALCQQVGEDVDLIVVDLSHPGIDPSGLMHRLEPSLASGTVTLAYGPHVHKARLDAASSAGFTAVMSRGQFHANMERLLAKDFG